MADYILAWIVLDAILFISGVLFIKYAFFDQDIVERKRYFDARREYLKQIKQDMKDNQKKDNDSDDYY